MIYVIYSKKQQTFCLPIIVDDSWPFRIFIMNETTTLIIKSPKTNVHALVYVSIHLCGYIVGNLFPYVNGGSHIFRDAFDKCDNASVNLQRTHVCHRIIIYAIRPKIPVSTSERCAHDTLILCNDVIWFPQKAQRQRIKSERNKKKTQQSNVQALRKFKGVPWQTIEMFVEYMDFGWGCVQ